MFRRLQVVLTAILGIALTVGPAPTATAAGGATYTWIGNTQNPAADNHSWSDQGNWEPNGVPGDGDSVIIQLPSGRCAAHVDGAPAVRLTNFVMISDACGVSVAGGHLTVLGVFQWNGGTIDAPMTVAGIGSLTGLSNQLKVLSKPMDVTGVLTMTLSSGDGGLRINDPNTLHIKPGGTLVSTGSNDITFAGCCINPAHVLNEGTIQVTTGELRVTAVQFDQHGTLKIDGGAQLITTKAPATASSGTTYSGSGSWNIGNQSVARFTGTQLVQSPFRLVLGGTAAAPGGRLGGTFTLSGTGGRLDWLAGRIEGSMTVAHGFTVRALRSLARPVLFGRDYTGASPVPAVVLNHGAFSFADGSGYSGGEQSRLVNAADGALTFAPGTRIDGMSCCTAPEKISNQGGRVVVGASSSGAVAVLTMISLENLGGTVSIATGKQLQLIGGAPATLASTSISGGGRILIAAPAKVSGTVRINAGSNLALIEPGSLNGNAIIGGAGALVWSGGGISGNVTLSTAAGVTVFPTAVKYVRNVNGGSVPSALRITVPTRLLPGTRTAVDRIDLGRSTLSLAGVTSVGNDVDLFGGRLVNTGIVTVAPGTGGSVTRTNGEFVNAGTARLVNGTLLVRGGDYRQTAGSTDLAAAATVTTYYATDRVLLSAGILTGTGTIKTSLYNDRGLVNPGSASAAGTLKVTKDFIQTGTGRLAFDLDRSTNDRLAVTGLSTLRGRVQFNTRGAAPAIGTLRTVLTTSRLTWAASCTYTSGTGSSTQNWTARPAARSLVVQRRPGADTHC